MRLVRRENKRTLDELVERRTRGEMRNEEDQRFEIMCTEK